MRKLIIKDPITKIGDKYYGHLHLPFVVFDKSAGIFKVSGYSLEEKEFVDLHYQEIFRWINEYIKDPNKTSDFYFGFHYINTYGLRCIIELIQKIKNLPNLRIFWIHDPEDIDMEEIAKDISKTVNFNIISKTDSFLQSMLFQD